MHMAAFQILGADPTPMAFGDLFTALQQGTLDAQENPIPIIETSQFDEVQKYLSMTGHIYAPTPVLIDKKFFDGLEPEYQNAIQEAANEAAVYEREQCDLQNEDGVQKLQDRGMVVNYPDVAPFKEATAAIYDEYVKEGAGNVSPDIYNRVVETINDLQKNK